MQQGIILRLEVWKFSKFEYLLTLAFLLNEKISFRKEIEFQPIFFRKTMLRYVVNKASHTITY
jgi:hypothetical protein